MAELKTKVNEMSVEKFLEQIGDGKKRQDAERLVEMMREITGEKAKMWGESIVGFGHYHYKYASGREGDWFVTGFSPRKQALTVYIMAGFEAYETLMKKLGKYKTGKSCLYIKSLEEVDEGVLRQLIEESVRHMKGG
jgi:hypothetical protein